MSLPSTLNQEPFTWRGIQFRWASTRSAWIGALSLIKPPAYSHWLFVQNHSINFVAWTEFDGGGYTEPCTMDTREDALECARLTLIRHCQGIIDRLEALPK